MNVSWRIHHDVVYINKQMLKFHESKVHQKAELWITRNLIFLCGKESWETRAPFCSETWYESKHFPRSLFFKGAIFLIQLLYQIKNVYAWSIAKCLYGIISRNTCIEWNMNQIEGEWVTLFTWGNIEIHLCIMEHELANDGKIYNIV